MRPMLVEGRKVHFLIGPFKPNISDQHRAIAIWDSNLLFSSRKKKTEMLEAITILIWLRNNASMQFGSNKWFTLYVALIKIIPIFR